MEATLQGFAGVEGLGKPKKPKKSKSPKAQKAKRFSSPAVLPSFAMQEYQPPSKVDALQPPPPPAYIGMTRIEPQGHSDRNNFINSGLDILDRFVNKGNAGGSDGGYDYSVPAPRIGSGDTRPGADIGRKAGSAAGNIADTAGDIVSQHPLAVLGVVGALGLLLVNPFGGGKKR